MYHLLLNFFDVAGLDDRLEINIGSNTMVPSATDISKCQLTVNVETGYDQIQKPYQMI